MGKMQTQPKANRIRKSPRGVRKIIRAFIFLFLFLVLSITGTLFYYYSSSQTVHDAIQVALSHNYSPAEAFPDKDEVNILLLGRDVDRDRHGRIVNTRGRTDAMLLVHADFRNHKINILSIPRDTLVHIPGHRGKRRISYANALGGPSLACQTLEEFLGVYPENYVLIDFNTFEKAVDAIGGLEVTVDKQLDYDDNWGNLHIHLKPGRQVLNGNQAMGFVRYRQSKSGDAESDFVRIGRQQELLRAAKAKLSNPCVMLKLPHILDMIRKDTETNLSFRQMMCLLSFAKSLPQSNIRMETLPALNTGGIFVKADPEATKKLIYDMFQANH